MIKEIFGPTWKKVLFALAVAVVYMIAIFSIPAIGWNPANAGDSLIQTALNLSFSMILVTVIYYPMSCGIYGLYIAFKKKSGWRPFLVPVIVILLWNPVTFNLMTRLIIKPNKTVTENGEVKPCGLSVTGFTEFSKAENAGLRVGDSVSAADGVKINAVADLIANCQTKKPGDTTLLETNHGTITVELVGDPSSGRTVLGVLFNETACSLAK